jgi:hypothetical protein
VFVLLGKERITGRTQNLFVGKPVFHQRLHHAVTVARAVALRIIVASHGAFGLRSLITGPCLAIVELGVVWLVGGSG